MILNADEWIYFWEETWNDWPPLVVAIVIRGHRGRAIGYYPFNCNNVYAGPTFRNMTEVVANSN